MNKKSSKKKHHAFLNARLTSTLSISLVLFVLGIIVLLGFLANNLSRHVRENIGFSIVLRESADRGQNVIAQLQNTLGRAPYVKSSKFISKDDALKEIMKELGENPEEVLGVNPLHSSIEVKMKAEYAHPDSIVWIEKSLAKQPAVDEIIFQKNLIQLVNDNIRRIGGVLFALSILLMIISFALISNTIRLSVYSKRFLIHTMKLVGATPGFIRRPFIGSNIVSGIVAAFIAIVALTGCLYYLTTEIGNVQNLLSVKLLLLTYGSILLLGIILSAISAYFAVNRYIKMNRDTLYYI